MSKWIDKDLHQQRCGIYALGRVRVMLTQGSVLRSVFVVVVDEDIALA
jgi:hypothetical protein